MIAPALRQKVFEHTIGRTSWTMPSLFAALLTAVPPFAHLGDSEPLSTSESGTEAAYLNYKRVLVPPTSWGSVAHSAGESTLTNIASLAFATATGGFSTVRRLAFFDAFRAGNLLFICDDQLDLTVGINVRPRAAVGDVSLSITGLGSEYFRGKVLEHAIGRTSWTMPSLYASLFVTAPDEDGTGGTEADYGGYARVAVPATSWETFDAGTAGDEYTDADIEWPARTGGATNSITAVGFHDASSSGNLLFLPATTGGPLSITGSDQPRISAGNGAFFG